MHYILNASFCGVARDIVNIQAELRQAIVVEVFFTRDDPRQMVECELQVTPPDYHGTTMTIGRLEETDPNLSISSYYKYKMEILSEFSYVHVNMTALASDDVTVDLSTTAWLSVSSKSPHLTSHVTFSFTAHLNTLPVKLLSDKSGMISEPDLRGNGLYPYEYTGVLDIQVPVNHSLFIKHDQVFMLCGLVLLSIHDQVTGKALWQDCGYQIAAKLSYAVFRQPVRVKLYLTWDDVTPLFNTTYTILPTSLEPQSDNVTDRFICSGTNFHSFSELLRCDGRQECQNDEDEPEGGCTYDSRCGASWELAGKCVTLIRAPNKINFHDAVQQCQDRKQRLLSLTPDVLRELIPKQQLLRVTLAFHTDLHLSYNSDTGPRRYFYRNIWRWGDGTSSFYNVLLTGVSKNSDCDVNSFDETASDDKHELKKKCAQFTNVIIAETLVDASDKCWTEQHLSIGPFAPALLGVDCAAAYHNMYILCESEAAGRASTDGDMSDSSRDSLDFGRTNQQSKQEISLSRLQDTNHWKTNVVVCPRGHVTKDFLSCDEQADCGAERAVTSCPLAGREVPLFGCDYGGQYLPYSLVCDHIKHCVDNSDEDFCVHRPCSTASFRCTNGQCVDTASVCDNKLDCVDESEEMVCPEIYKNVFQLDFHTLTTVYLDGRGRPNFTETDQCPPTHFLCPDGYCLPVFLRCNGLVDCVGRYDESHCDTYTCPGFYRCRGSRVCVHPEQVCDGVFHCPEFDDELLCDLPPCPDACQCRGLTYICTAPISASSSPRLRYLDLSNTNGTANTLADFWYLIGVKLSNTGLVQAPELALHNLRSLDLSYNFIASLNLQTFRSLKNLIVLKLTGNPLVHISNAPLDLHLWNSSSDVTYSLEKISENETLSQALDSLAVIELDLSFTQLETFGGKDLDSLLNLRRLNVSWSKLHTITDLGVSAPGLEELDLRKSPVRTFSRDSFKELGSLRVVLADNFKLCCQAVLPEGFKAENCQAETDLLASCEDLLRSSSFRVFLGIFACLSLAGNAGSFVARFVLGKKGAGLGSYAVFVANLCAADFCMGLYLAVIGVADLVYKGQYVFYDDQWKTSAACQFAGFLSLLSSEVSALVICLITLDRFLVLRFPFSRRHFGSRSSLYVCVLTWTVGVVLAGIPLMPFASHWQFYSQSGICIPLPFTARDRFAGWPYSFSVMIVVNFVLFVVVAAGQVLLYVSVSGSSVASSRNVASKDLTIARRLSTVIVSNFLCWFPVGLLGLLAATGTPIPGEVNVGVAIFVLPVNSTLDPFLYTLNTVLEKRQKRLEDRLLEALQREECKPVSDNVIAGTNNAGSNNAGSNDGSDNARMNNGGSDVAGRNDILTHSDAVIVTEETNNCGNGNVKVNASSDEEQRDSSMNLRLNATSDQDQHDKKLRLLATSDQDQHDRKLRLLATSDQTQHDRKLRLLATSDQDHHDKKILRVNATTYQDQTALLRQIEDWVTSNTVSVTDILTALANEDPSLHQMQAWSQQVKFSKNGDLKMVGGRASSEGFLQMYHGKRWIFVCGFTSHSLEQIACRQLGYNHMSEVTSSLNREVELPKPYGVRFHGCKGTERRLSECSYTQIAIHCLFVLLSCKRMSLTIERDSSTEGMLELPYAILEKPPLDDYPFEGFFTLQVPEAHSVLVKVSKFFLPKVLLAFSVAARDQQMLEIWEKPSEEGTPSSLQGQTQRRIQLSRWGSVHLLTFRRTIHFRAFMYAWEAGDFRLQIKYALVPTYMEPQVVQPLGLYNCSVPHFHRFKGVLSCDWVRECQGEEDERGCAMYRDTDHCGQTAVSIGKKCYTTLMAPVSHTWHEASKACLDTGQRLAQLNDADSFNFFTDMVRDFNMHAVFLGVKIGLITTKLPLAYLYRHVWRSSQGVTVFGLHNKHLAKHSSTMSTCLLLDHTMDRTNDFRDRSTIIMYRHDCRRPLEADNNIHFHGTVVCESGARGRFKSDPPAVGVTKTRARNQTKERADDRFQSCALGHVTKHFLSCDYETKCGAQKVMTSCQLAGQHFAMFVCEFGGQSVPLSLVCDHIDHCTDGSDEAFCHFGTCPLSSFTCWSGQCVNTSAICDGKLDCYDQTDEIVCRGANTDMQWDLDEHVPPDVVIWMDGKGHYTWRRSSTCPVSHFRCPSDGFCLPIYLLCNGAEDCSGREDEVGCDSYICPSGYYRCRSSQVCLQPQLVCDGVFQCPDYDDELLCDLPPCPAGCVCQGLAYVCNNTSDVFLSPLLPPLRYLDVSNIDVRTNMSRPLIHDLESGFYLINLYLSNTGLGEVPVLTLPNLRVLDLSYNNIAAANMQTFRYLKNLRVLFLEGNPLLQITNSLLGGVAGFNRSSVLSGMTDHSLHTDVNGMTDRVNTSSALSDVTDFALNASSVQGTRNNEKSSTVSSSSSDPLPLQDINLSRTFITVYNGSVLADFPKLLKLNVSHSGLHTITVEGFNHTPALTVFDARGSPVKHFPGDLLKDLNELKFVYVDNFKLCCKDVLPSIFDQSNCHSAPDPLSSCEDLVSSKTYFVFIWTFSVLAIFGNAVSFVLNMMHSFDLNRARHVKDALDTDSGAKKELNTTNDAENAYDTHAFWILLANLNMADFVSGVYVVLIGVSDGVYRGQYLWHDNGWKESVACTVAGVLFVTSREVSVIFLCLLVIDRFCKSSFCTLHLRSFHSFRFGVPLTVTICVVAWIVGLVVAIIPLLPFASRWQFYSQSGVCIPLLFSATHSANTEFKGRLFWEGLLMVNFVLFSIIAVAWAASFFIGHFLAGTRSRVSLLTNTEKRTTDTDLAQRLKLIVVTDFLCWVPVGLMVLFASHGTEISKEVWVGVTLILLPVNSAINPPLYAYSVVMERRHKLQMEKLLKRLKAVNKAGKLGNKRAGQVVANPRQTLQTGDRLGLVNTTEQGVSSGTVNTTPTPSREETNAAPSSQNNEATATDTAVVSHQEFHFQEGTKRSMTKEVVRTVPDPTIGEEDGALASHSSETTVAEQLSGWIRSEVVSVHDILQTLAQDQTRRGLVLDWLAAKAKIPS